MGDSLARARAATLLGSVLTALSSGTNYVYSAYAPQLGSRLHITNTQLNIIGLCGNMGVYTTGPLLGRLTDERGPKPLLIAAGFLLFIGYTGLRIYYDAGAPNGETFPLTSLIVMSIFTYMIGAGGNSGLTAAANATAKSFPERMRGTTVGLVVSGMGLSAFFFSTLANWLFPGNTSSFLLFISLGTTVPVLIGFFTVRPVPHPERPDAGPGGLTLSSEPNSTDSSTHLLRHGVRTSVYAEEASLYAESRRGTRRHSELGPELDTALSRPVSFALSTPRHSIVESPISRRSSGGEMFPRDPADMHGRRLLLGWEFWLLFTILSLLSGTGLMFINNVGSIAQALSAQGNPDFDRVKAGKVQAAQVSIISLANCAARIGIGAGADFAKSRFAVHRSYLLSLISILFIISQIVGSQVDNVDYLWQTSVMLGLGYGGIWGLLPTITIEWFGLSHFSENWGFVSISPLLCGNLFSILFGRNLDAHVPAATDGTLPLESRSVFHALVPIPDDSEPQCLEGRLCYVGAMTMTTFACVLALLLSLVAAWRDWRQENAEIKYESLAQEMIWGDEEDEL